MVLVLLIICAGLIIYMCGNIVFGAIMIAKEIISGIAITSFYATGGYRLAGIACGAICGWFWDIPGDALTGMIVGFLCPFVSFPAVFVVFVIWLHT